MSNKCLFDAIKLNSKRFLTIYKKGAINLHKLLKKRNKTNIGKYKRGLMSKEELIKFYDTYINYINISHDEKIRDLKKMVDVLVQLKIVRLVKSIDYVGEIEFEMDKAVAHIVSTKQIRQITVCEEENDNACDKTITANTMGVSGLPMIFNMMGTTAETINVDIDVTVESDNAGVNIGRAVNKHTARELIPCLKMDKNKNISDDMIQNNEDIVTYITMSCASKQGIILTQSPPTTSHTSSTVSDDYSKSKIFQPHSDTKHNLDISQTFHRPKTNESFVRSNNHTGSPIQAKTDISHPPNTNDIPPKKSSVLFKSKFHSSYNSSQKVATKIQNKTQTNIANKGMVEDAKRCKDLSDDTKSSRDKVRVGQPLLNSIERMEKSTKMGEEFLGHKLERTVQLADCKRVDSPARDALRPANRTPQFDLSAISDSASFKVPDPRPCVAKCTLGAPPLSDSFRRIIADHRSFDLAGLESANSDEDDVCDQEVPNWVSKKCGTLSGLSRYHFHNTDPLALFRAPYVLPISIPGVFCNYEYNVSALVSVVPWKDPCISAPS